MAREKPESGGATSGRQYLDGRTLDRIKRIDVRARAVVEGFMTGNHRSPYNGFAVEFAAHREYSPGDDLRHIDWRVWSRTDRLYIKQYEEETNLNCHLLVDRSRSMRYGGQGGWSKYDHAATAAASLAWLMNQQQDAVGLTLFSNQVDRSLRPSTNQSQLKQLMHELEQAGCDATTDLPGALGTVASQFRQRGMVILLSDLLLGIGDLEKALAQFRLHRHDMIVMHVMHGDELEFPFQDNTLFRGLEQSVQLLAEPRALRNSYLEAMKRHLEGCRRACGAAGVDYVLLDSSKPLDAALAGWLSWRSRTRRKSAGI